MAASGQTLNRRTHTCTPPPGFAPEHGLLWICPDCRSELVYRPVHVRELGRVINLWVRFYEPPSHRWIPPNRRRNPATRRPLTAKEQARLKGGAS